MKHCVLIALFGLLAGTAWANTFELSDPANEMLQEKQEREQEQPRPVEDQPVGELKISGDILCSVDTSNGDCSCIDRDRAEKLSMTQEDCAARVLKSLLGR